jgi:hypothetical protein
MKESMLSFLLNMGDYRHVEDLTVFFCHISDEMRQVGELMICRRSPPEFISCCGIGGVRQNPGNEKGGISRPSN